MWCVPQLICLSCLGRTGPAEACSDTHTHTGNLPEVFHSLRLSVSCTCHRESSLCMRVQVMRHMPAGRWVGHGGSSYWVVAWTFRTSLNAGPSILFWELDCWRVRGFGMTGHIAIRVTLLLVRQCSGFCFGLGFEFRDIYRALNSGSPLRPPRPGRHCVLASARVGGKSWRIWRRSWSCCYSCCFAVWVAFWGLELGWIILVHFLRFLWRQKQTVSTQMAHITFVF